MKAFEIQSARDALEHARFDVEVITSRLRDGEGADTTIIYADSLARQLDELAVMLEAIGS